jgi:hypothetical protein
MKKFNSNNIHRKKEESESEESDDDQNEVVSQISFENRIKYMKSGVPQEEFTEETKELELERIRKIAQQKKKALGIKKKVKDA